MALEMKCYTRHFNRAMPYFITRKNPITSTNSNTTSTILFYKTLQKEGLSEWPYSSSCSWLDSYNRKDLGGMLGHFFS